ncbi:MAG TPA: GNAT family N-acetyltransferase [Gemmatimonadaceae bacterium]|nr:GNAT family N-acetyltransferase [Gemmatimonadaceae bacterium]
MAITIRPATTADVPALGRLGTLLVRTHHDFDPMRFMAASPGTELGYGSYLRSILGKTDVAVLVAEDGGTVIGYAYAGMEGVDYMALRGPAGAIYDVVVHPDHRRKGAGRRLLNAAMEFLRSRDAPRVVLSTATQNVAAQRLFESAGFRRTMIEMTAELDDSTTAT